MLTLLVAVSSIAAPVPAHPAEKTLECAAYSGHFEKNTSGLKGDVSHLVFTDAESFGRVFGSVPPLGAKKHKWVSADVFEKNVVVAAITRGTSPAIYSDISTTLSGTTLTVRYKSALAAPTTATFASPLILSVPKDEIKTVVFAANGKETAPIEVK